VAPALSAVIDPPGIPTPPGVFNQMPPATFRAAEHSSESSNLQEPPSAPPAAPPPPAVPAVAPPSPAPSRSPRTSSPRYRLPAAPGAI